MPQHLDDKKLIKLLFRFNQFITAIKASPPLFNN
jgi:hypothetical protein